MIRKTMTNSKIDSISKNDLLSNFDLFLKSDEPKAQVSQIFADAYGSDSVLSFESLVTRIQATQYDDSFNVYVGTVLFFLGTELPEHGC
jgi:hypothetical protein